MAFSTARIDAMAWTVVQTPANALRERPRIPRVPSLENDLDPAEHRRGGPGVLDGATINLGLDPQVAFDAGNRIDDNTRHDQDSLLFGVTGSALSPTRFMI
jgi:hypothetical protein